MLRYKYDFILSQSKCYLNFEKTNVNPRRTHRNNVNDSANVSSDEIIVVDKESQTSRT